MGKADDKIDQARADSKRLAKFLERARKLRQTLPEWQPQPLPPEEAKRFREGVKRLREQEAFQRRAAHILDEHAAISDGLIAPPWAKKPLKPASEPPSAETPASEAEQPEQTEPGSGAEPKSKRKKERKSYWDDEVDRVLREEFPDNSATNFKPKDVKKKVLEVLDPKIKTSGEKPPSRGLILRKSGHWKT
jgi:hypothetical protein